MSRWSECTDGEKGVVYLINCQLCVCKQSLFQNITQAKNGIIDICMRWMISALRLTSVINHSLRCHQSLLLPVDPQGTKGFKCDVCAREFTLSANLRRHMLIHASVRPFQCHVCFKSFVQKQTLKTHMIVHLPVKPFKCKVRLQTFCELTFVMVLDTVLKKQHIVL